MEGPSLTLTPPAAQAVGMALHELATNAVKHGALSSDRGTIRIDWSVADQAGESCFHIAWTERGGPPATPPRRAGFGRTVVERMIAQALAGKAELDFAPAGIVWRFACPADHALESRL